jgi:selenocysteine-specific elongation factor
MLAGVSTLDISLLVIAADDGIMPQTSEHFEILQLLNIQHGLIALTKIDMVEPEWVELVKEEIRTLVKGTFLQDAPLFPVSNRTGQGVPELRKAIFELAEKLPPRADKGVFRLWIDRVFIIKGAGSIVAGTVLSGELHPNDKVELLPQRKVLRVKKLQVHNKLRDKCGIGERVAINLQGVEIEEIERGNLLTAVDYFQPTYMLNVKFHLLSSCKRPLPSRSRVRLHLGTAEILCRIINLSKGDFIPGTETMAQLRLEAQSAPDIGDAFVIRDYSPGRTIGGGIILDTHPDKLKYLPEKKLDEMAEFAGAEPEKMVELLLRDNPQRFFDVETIARERALASNDIKRYLNSLIEKGVVAKLGETAIVHLEEYRRNIESLKRFLRDFHAENPMKLGIKKSELKTRLFPQAEIDFFDTLLKDLLSKKEIEIRREKIFIAGHSVEFTPEQTKLKEEIAKIYYDAGYVTPEFEELVELLGNPKTEKVREVLTGMVEAEILLELEVKMDKPIIFHSRRVEEAKKMIIDTIREKGEAKFFELREKLNSTRKFTTPLLVYFDEQGITKRIGDVRVLRKE